MLTQKIQELARLKAKAAKLEGRVLIEREVALASLFVKYGYENLKTFIKALKEAGSDSGAGKAKATKAVKPRKRKRAKVTDEIKAAVKAGFEAGKRAGAIAKETGISRASVQLLKKTFGFTKARKSAATG